MDSENIAASSLPEETRDIYSKYDEAYQFLQTRKKRQVNQIVLLNNLQRGDQNIASTLLITLFNRILSNLYDDKMQVKFIPGEEIDQRKVNSLNILAQNDYREMDKDKLDYDWVWDTLFFGRGYMETLRFDKERRIMQPHVINPLVFQYDPYFDNHQDWRYYSKWITKNKYQLDRLIASKVIKGISDTREIPSGIEATLWDYKVTREKAKLVNTMGNDTFQGDVFQILEHYGYDKEGNKCVFWLDKNFNKILYQKKLDLKDGEKGDSKWPLVIKEAFREPHSSVNFSVADLLEDKHRAESVLLNLAFIAAKDKANPLYWYDPEKVRDLSQLFSRQINQHIPVNGPGGEAIGPLNTQDPLPPSLVTFMQTLAQKANDPIGTGMALAPAKKGKQSATETAIQQQLNDLAQSLQSKVMKFGEENFWKDWYQRYKRNTKAGDEKIATIVGVKGMTFENIDLGDIHTKYPPGVLIFSAKEAEYKELVERRDLMQMYPQFQSTFDPDGMRAFNRYIFLPKFLHDPSMIDVLVPKTIDELNAEEENDTMNGNEMPDVKDTDNHEQHLAVHRMAQNTWAKWIHIHWHEELLGLAKKQQQEAQMQEQAGEKPGDKGGPGGDKKKPQDDKEAAAPLQKEAQPTK